MSDLKLIRPYVEEQLNALAPPEKPPIDWGLVVTWVVLGLGCFAFWFVCVWITVLSWRGF